MEKIKSLVLGRCAGTKPWFPPSTIIRPTVRPNLYLTNLCNRLCNYCYAQDWITNDEENAQHMSLTNLDIIIHWLKTSGINTVQLIGGEPMLHPNILDVVKKLLQSDIVIHTILTNGLGNTELYKSIMSFDTKENIKWLVNVDHPSTYAKEEWDLLNRNLELLKWMNAEKLLGHNPLDKEAFQLQLAITFIEPDQDYNYIIDLAKEYHVSFIRFANSQPSSNKLNRYVDFDNLIELKPTLMRFIRDCVREGIMMSLECLLPPCIFTGEEWRLILLVTPNLRSLCTPLIEIFSDLTVAYCFNMRKILPNYKLKQMNVNEIYRKNIEDSSKYRDYPMPRCVDCHYFINRICQGYCLRLRSDLLPQN